MIVLKGTGVFAGVATGKIAFYKRAVTIDEVSPLKINNPEEEILRFEDAQKTAINELNLLYKKALLEVGEDCAEIFSIHQMMLEDDDFCDNIKNIVSEEKINLEFAISLTAKKFARMFSEMDDEYMQGRSVDVKDVSNRLIRVLQGAQGHSLDFPQPIILAAEDLAPSETIQLDKDKILAIITKGGSTRSHTAILARMKGIPAIIGLGKQLTDDLDGKEAAVDGLSGEIYIDPETDTLNKLIAREKENTERGKQLESLKGKDNVSIDGKHIDIYANIGFVNDVDMAIENDAGGIGLFRSEFLYLHATDYPCEEEQFKAYKTVAEKMAGKRVVIRTFDIGADKQVGYFNLPMVSHLLV